MSDARSSAIRRSPQPQRENAAGAASSRVLEIEEGRWLQNQVIQGTVVVLVACLVVGSYLYVNDIVWKHVVAKVFLGQ